MMLRTCARSLLPGVVAGHLVLISVQVQTPSSLSAFYAATFGALAEAPRLVSGAVAAGREVWDGYVALRGVRAENAALRAANAELELRLQTQRAAAQRADGLERLLAFRRSVDLVTLGARVIGGDATPWFRTITVDRGTRDGVRRDLAVVAPGGVVGRVMAAPGARAAKVQLLIDPNASAGVLVERTRAPGIIAGDAAGAALRLDYVPNDEDVVVGDVVVTSGTDGIYPPGLVVGTVAAAPPGAGPYRAIAVDPVIEFNRMEHVLIVTGDDRVADAGGGR